VGRGRGVGQLELICAQHEFLSKPGCILFYRHSQVERGRGGVGRGGVGRGGRGGVAGAGWQGRGGRGGVAGAGGGAARRGGVGHMVVHVLSDMLVLRL
jgi:hypothetical protein